jgi:hypothetical protein
MSSGRNATRRTILRPWLAGGLAGAAGARGERGERWHADGRVGRFDFVVA